MDRKILILVALGVSLFSYFMSKSNFGLSAMLFYSAGIYALYVIAKKGYFTKVSIVMFLIVGWWFLIILIGAGGITLFVAALLPEKRRCTHCKELVSKDATKCPKCQGELALVGKT